MSLHDPSMSGLDPCACERLMFGSELGVCFGTTPDRSGAPKGVTALLLDPFTGRQGAHGYLAEEGRLASPKSVLDSDPMTGPDFFRQGLRRKVGHLDPLVAVGSESAARHAAYE